MSEKHTPGPWKDTAKGYGLIFSDDGSEVASVVLKRDIPLIEAAPDLLEALKAGRRAIGDHHAPDHCYATGPMTGDRIRDLIQCPACSFIAMYDAAIAKATGETP